jgi:type II secretory pathway predicted ATPase ExeA
MMDESRIPSSHSAADAEAPAAHEPRVPEPGYERRFLEHFGLSEQPFGVTPDPRFLYLGPKQRQALAALNYGTETNRGFLTLTGQPGLGKTSLLFNYLEGLRNKARTVFLFQTDCDSRELMSYILTDLGIPCAGQDLPEMHSILNRVLTAEMQLGRRFVLVIDEAQNLSEKVLESVRLLSNFETPWMKLMQIVLAGQPQLTKRLAKPSMAQLQQRISFAIELEPLSSAEVTAYIDHRLWVAGHTGTPLFSPAARTLLAERSEGVPRKINNLCFCAMSLAWATKKKTIDREILRDVLEESNPRPVKTRTEAAPIASTPSKQDVVDNLRSAAVLTVKDPPGQSWLPKLILTCAALLVLGWGGMRLDLGKRCIDLWREFSAAAKGSALVAPAPVSLAPATPADPSNLSSDSKSETRTDDRNPGAAQQDGNSRASSSQEPN